MASDTITKTSDETDSDRRLSALHEEYARTSDFDLEGELLEEYRGLARSFARRFVGHGVPLDDLMQVAMLALLKALRRFDLGFGVKFSTYAGPTMLGELKRHFRDHGWAVRAPRRLQELHLEAKAHVEDLNHELGRSPTVDEVAARCGVSEEMILQSMELGQARVSLSLDVQSSPHDDEVATRRELGADDPGYDGVDGRVSVGALLKRLRPGDVALLRMRFAEGLTQQEIAERLGTNQMSVSRQLARTMIRLRALAVTTDRA
jgi:RNA polymerase sigma-B factor